MDKLDNKNFNLGDSLELELNHEDAYGVERVFVTDWKAGPRGLFGHSPTIKGGIDQEESETYSPAMLPILERNHQLGGLLLGSGSIRLKRPIPVNDFPPENMQVANLFYDNRIERSDKRVQIDMVVLLEEENGRLKISGMDHSLQVYPESRTWNWERDPLGRFFIQPDSEEVNLNWKKLPELIRVAGGALPVTVTGISNYAVFFSRKYQAKYSRLSKNKLALASVAGLVPSENKTVIMNWGSSLFEMDRNELIYGLPDRLIPAAIEILSEKDVPIWCRGTDKKITTGTMKEDASEIAICPILAIDRKGIICRSMKTERLYWLPSRECSHSRDLAENTLEATVRFWRQRGSVLKARVSRNPSEDHFGISLLKTRRATLEGQELVPGNQLHARMIVDLDQEMEEKLPPGARKKILVESLKTNRLMTCMVAASSSINQGNEFPIEIERLYRRVPITAKIGERHYYLDVPEQEKGIDLWENDTLPDSFVRFLDAARGPKVVHPRFNFETCSRHDLEDLLNSKAFDAVKGNNFDSWCPKAALCWFDRFSKHNKIDAHVAVIVILILHRFNLVEESTDLLLTIGKRALRSQHWEALCRLWLSDESLKSRTDGYWFWLNKILKTTLGNSTELSENDLQMLRTVIHTMTLRYSFDNSALLHALKASAGMTCNPKKYASSCTVTRDLSQFYIQLETGRDLKPCLITYGQILKLRDILNTIVKNSNYICLSEPIPENLC